MTRQHVPLVLALILASAACADTAPAPPALPADFEVSVGGGGGFAGSYRTVRLRPDGSLVVEFRGGGSERTDVEAGRLDEAARRATWELLRSTDVAALGCEPSNMTDAFDVRADGVTLRACAPMDAGSPEFRRVMLELERLVAAPAAGVTRPPPPLPAMPGNLVIEAGRGSTRVRLARAGAELPSALAEGALLVEDAVMLPLWESLFSTRYYSGASIESRDGQALPGAPYDCGEDSFVRVTVGEGASWETRHRCAEGDPPFVSLADAVLAAAR